MSDAIALSNMLATFAATYLLHSTVLLSMCWLSLKLTRATSHFLVERTWKLAVDSYGFTVKTASIRRNIVWDKPGDGNPKRESRTVSEYFPTLMFWGSVSVEANERHSSGPPNHVAPKIDSPQCQELRCRIQIRLPCRKLKWLSSSINSCKRSPTVVS
jgi:hypothetical protein